MNPIEFTEAGDPVFRSVRRRRQDVGRKGSRAFKHDNRLPAGSGIVIAMVASAVFWFGVALWAWTSGGAVLSSDGLELCHEYR